MKYNNRNIRMKERRVGYRKKGQTGSRLLLLATVAAIAILVFHIRDIKAELEEMRTALKRIEVLQYGRIETSVKAGPQEETDYVSSIAIMNVEKPVQRTWAETIQRLEELGKENPDILIKLTIVKERFLMSKVKIGIVGCGGIANNKHLPAMKRVGNFNIVAFCDLIEERAVKAKEDFGTPDARIYTDYQELVREDLDAVYVLTPNSAHAPVAIAAMKAGKHVLCEKPMAVTLQECEDMVQAAEEHHRILMIGQNQRFAKAHREAKKILLRKSNTNN